MTDPPLEPIADRWCSACDCPQPVNDLGLCEDCNAKLDRDMLRSQAWAHSSMAVGVPKAQYEALRKQIIRDYGSAYELITPPGKQKKRKHKRAHSRTTQRKREIAAQAIRAYTTADVLHSAREFLYTCDAEWVNFTRLSHHLYTTFFHLKPKHLGQPSKKYMSLLKFLADYPDVFDLRSDETRQGCYWIRPHTKVP